MNKYESTVFIIGKKSPKKKYVKKGYINYVTKLMYHNFKQTINQLSR